MKQGGANGGKVDRGRIGAEEVHLEEMMEEKRCGNAQGFSDINLRDSKVRDRVIRGSRIAFGG